MGSDVDNATRLAQEHYENFPVGSRFLPKALRPHVHRLYAFARVADDLVDEAGDLAALHEWRSATRDALDGRPSIQLLVNLASTVREFALPETLLFRLLDAFERDLAQGRYTDMDDLLSYCRDSADPVGRLMLHLFRRADAVNEHLSDRICTGLQILNHCQDVRSDYLERDRVYLPADRMLHFGVSVDDLAADTTSRGLQRVVAELVDDCAARFAEGFELPRRLGGRSGLEIRAVLQAACVIVDRMRTMNYDVARRRPTIHKADAPELLLRTLLPWKPRL
ncbi:MAG: squalene synthase HpnC [Planctomycetes bacterium]|nr:squalene synthase HpnC [Planctomycetota bacterium]